MLWREVPSASAKIKIVGFRAGLIAPAAAPELQSQAIDDTARNLVLDRQDVRQLPVKSARPQWKVVAHPDQLRDDPQLLAVAQHRTFQDVIGLQLCSRLMDVPRPVFKSKRRSLGAYRQPVNDGQVADNLVGEAVGEVIIGRILAHAGQGQNRYGDRSVLALNPPPAHDCQGCSRG
jgi:hypothetical protein